MRAGAWLAIGGTIAWAGLTWGAAQAPVAAAGSPWGAEGAGVSGTLNIVVAAPDGTIFGSDDRGVFKLSASGWQLIRPVEWVVPRDAATDPLAAQFSGWPGALAIVPGASAQSYTLVAADGPGGDIIRSTDKGATWSDPIKVLPTATSFNAGSVVGLCWYPPGSDPSLGGNLYSIVQKAQNDMTSRYAVSSSAGQSWSPLMVTEESPCDLGGNLDLSMVDPVNPTREVSPAWTAVTMVDGQDEIAETVYACEETIDASGFVRAAIYANKVLLVTENGCYARSTYDPESQSFGEWTEGTMANVGSVGIFSQGYVEVPTTMTMYGDTAYLASQSGVFAYSWSTDTWVNAGKGIPLRDRVAVPTTRYGDRVVIGGYQGVATVLGLFSSSDAGATFSRMRGIPAEVEPRGLALTDGNRMYLSDYDVAMDTFRVWSSEDNGATWTLATETPMEGEPIEMVAKGSTVYLIVRSPLQSLSMWRSTDGALSWTPLSDTACGWSYGLPRQPRMSLTPSGGVVALYTGQSGTSDLRGCVAASASETTEGIISTVKSGVGVISLIDYLDGRLVAYLGPNGATNATPLTSTDGRTWTKCTTDADAINKQPAYIASVARDADGSLLGTVVNPINGTQLVRSTDDGCTWSGSDAVPFDEEDLDASSMVLPEAGEAEIAGVDDEVLGRESAPMARAGTNPAITAVVRSSRVIGVGQSGSTVAKIRFGKAPAAPGKGTASAGKRKVTLKFRKPATVGAGLVGYTATCTASRQPTRTATAGASATSITVGALAAKVAYACTVVARDAAGPGAAARWTGLKPRS